MTETEARNLGNKMAALERQQASMAADIAEIKLALVGGYDGNGGLVRRIERVEDRITNLVQWQREHEQEVEKIRAQYEGRLHATERQMTIWQAQMRAISWTAGSGGLGGVIALIWTLIQAFGQ